MRLIIAQILGLIALVLICLSYYYNKKKTFLLFQLLGDIFYASSFLVLNVWVGGSTTLISLVRCIVLFLYERKDKKPPLFIYFIFFASYLLSGILLYQTPYDIIAIVAFQIFNLAMFIKNIKVVRFLMLPPNLMIVVYNIVCQTYTNALLDCVESIVLIVSIISHAIIEKRQKEKEQAITNIGLKIDKNKNQQYENNDIDNINKKIKD